MNIAEFIFTSIKKALPSINWSLGSTLRELIVTPIVTTTDIANKALTNQINNYSVKDYINNPEEHATEINNLYNVLELEDIPPQVASGVVTIFTQSAEPPPIYKNTTFYYENIPLNTTKTVYPSIAYSNVEGFVQLKQLGYKSYAFEVPVQSSGNNVSLTTDVDLSWTEAPSDVYTLKLTSPLSGGYTNTSLLNKALKIKDYLAPNLLTMNEGITKLLRTKLPSIVVDAAFAYDLNSTTTSYVYVKTSKAPGTFDYVTTGYRGADGLFNVTTNIPGVMEVVAAYRGANKLNIRTLNIENNLINCSIEAYTDEETIPITLQVKGILDYKQIQEVLDGYFIGSPYKVEIKAPAIFNVGIEFDYTGSVLATDEIESICEYIQSMPLNQLITDQLLSSLLKTKGNSLYGTAVYTISSSDGHCYKQPSSAYLYTTTSAYYAIYSGYDKIKANYV